MEYLNIVLRSMTSLLALFLLTKMLGKKQVSQLSAFDYVIGISMGSIAAEMTINYDAPFMHGLVAMTTYAIIAYVISYLTLKSIKLRRFVTGTPVILIQDGKIIRENLKKSHVDINELLQECRSQGYFNIDDVAFAIMEACGKFSFLPKTPNRPAQLKDLNINAEAASLYANVIMDGKIMEKHLNVINKNEKWLLKEIKKQGYSDPSSIFLATVDANNKVKIFEREDNIKPRDIIE